MPGTTLPLTAAQRYQAILRRKGRTFYWASRLFGKGMAADIAVLYAFCRYLDDLADETDSITAARRLAAVAQDIATRTSTVPVVRDFLALAERTDISIATVDTLLATLRRDAGAVGFRNWRETIRYSYGVAATVGIMFCAIAGVKDRAALPFAVDLGIAMQLTNIARDVLEDAGRGRVYLPLPAPETTDPARAIVQGDIHTRTATSATIRETLALAEHYYRSADCGMRYLPWRVRAAVLVAARCYEAIGTVIRRRGEDYWAGRCYVSTGEKIWHTLRALAALFCNPRYWRRTPGQSHLAMLHAPLARLPGADPWA